MSRKLLIGIFLIMLIFAYIVPTTSSSRLMRDERFIPFLDPPVYSPIPDWESDNPHYSTGAELADFNKDGWLDLVVVKHSCLISGITKIAITKLDVLDGLDTVKICIKYELNGKEIDFFPANIEDVKKCVPIYKKFPGWKKIDGSSSKISDLPKEARKYIEFIEKETKIPIALVSIGPGRNETIEV